MNPVIPLLALGGLAALALGAKNKRATGVPMLPPYVPPPVSEPPPAPFEPPPEPPAQPHRPHGKREKPPSPSPVPAAPAAQAPAPSPASPPQTLPELAKKAEEIFTAPSPPPPLPTPPLIPPVPAAPSPGSVTPPPTSVAVPIASAPAGFDPVKARRTAPRIASHLKSKGIANYSRQALREFQTLAGIKADGIYGGQSAGALRYYLGGASPPAAMFKPVQEVPYTPPGS